MVVLSTTLRTPGVPQAVLRANSRSDQLWTLPVSVTSVPWTLTEISCASCWARRFKAASMSDLTTGADTLVLMVIWGGNPEEVASSARAARVPDRGAIAVQNLGALFAPFSLRCSVHAAPCTPTDGVPVQRREWGRFGAHTAGRRY